MFDSRMSSSDSLVSKSVEEGFAPRLINQRVQLALINGVFDLSVDHFAVNFALVEQLVVLKAEGSLLRHGFPVGLITDLQKNLLIIKGVACALCKLTKSDEIVRVNTVECLNLGGESAPVHDVGLHLYLATELGLSLIYGDKSDLSVLIPPEAAPFRLHISSGQPIMV